jgi:hypothetical protein
MPSISTQTTTFLPAVVPVLQHRSLTKRFLARMMRKHFNDVKQNNTTRSKFQREFTANKKMFSKMLKDMTLTVRKNKAENKKVFNETMKALKEADKAVKEQAKKAAKKAQEQRKFDSAVKKFSIELKTAARKESKQDAKEAKKQANIIKSDMRAEAKEKLDALSVKGDFTFIPFVGYVKIER